MLGIPASCAFSVFFVGDLPFVQEDFMVKVIFNNVCSVFVISWDRVLKLVNLLNLAKLLYRVSKVKFK